jgi:hypothetical protein
MRTSYDSTTEPEVPKPVLHIVRDLDGKHVDGHNRLRVDAEERERRLQEIERHLAEHDEQWRNAAKRTTDIQQLRFTPGMFAATLAICASVIGGSYASTAGIRTDMTAQATEVKVLSEKLDAIKQHNEDAAKFQDLTTATMQREMTRIGGQATMIDTKLSNLMSSRR